MNENRAEIKAKIVETEMKKYFGSLVSDFNLIDAFCGNGHEEFSLGFKYCDYFDMRFNYGQGACGCCICYDWGDNNEAILIKTSIDGWWEKISIQWKKYFHELKKELDLRIPDDYLKEFYKKLKSTSERKEYINRGSHLSYMFLLVKSVPGVFFPTSSTWTLLLTGMNCGKPTIRSVFAMRRLPWDAGPGFLKTASERRLPSVGEIFLSRR